MSALPPTSDDGAFWHLWLSPYFLPVVTVADQVGTFAAISGKAKDTGTLARELEVDERALGIQLGLLAALGMVERRLGKWRATAMARTWMHPDGAGYYGPLLGGFKNNYPLHQQMLSALRSGEAQGREGHASNVEEWERGALPLEQARGIAAFMHSHSVANSLAVARMPLWDGVGTLLDVGGGSGVFAIELARQWPDLKAKILEIDTMCEAAQAYIDSAGIGERVDTVAVDMFRQDWPTGYDAHFFSNIFHDWSEKTNRLLAKKSFDALPSGGRIVLHEILMDDDGTGPLIAAAFSVLMLLGTRGKQYTLREFEDILEGAGFVDVEAQRTGGGYYSLVTARKP
ncbi:methyltransferase [Parerythrobacter aestuarii]|uniref:methyltransferase n=1 Tax=Parerythrobacter aestuarii TaxID=3020909 RepID=UPI0024DE47CF|nr:methyltransferase [Parerythrobacter aestuarii]